MATKFELHVQTTNIIDNENYGWFVVCESTKACCIARANEMFEIPGTVAVSVVRIRNHGDDIMCVYGKERTYEEARAMLDSRSTGAEKAHAEVGMDTVDKGYKLLDQIIEATRHGDTLQEAIDHNVITCGQVGELFAALLDADPTSGWSSAGLALDLLGELTETVMRKQGREF